MHGPLARIELGESNVQGIDYAYTLQGWLKSINSGIHNPNYDMGQDGKSTTPVNLFARDAYAFSLGYFYPDMMTISGDIAEITNNPTSGFSFGVESYSADGSQGLYNGNIRHSVLAMDSVNNQYLGYVYKYDQLNRYIGQLAFNNVDTLDKEWDNTGSIEDYKEGVQYDPNGNITNYLRHGTTANADSLSMDSLTYHYTAGTNQLVSISDTVSSSNYNIDLDDGASYQYDANGNLISDFAELCDMQWNNAGKLEHLFKYSPDFTINYSYDPFGNRIGAESIDNNTYASMYTFYVRDAQGNIMATYTSKDYDSLKLNELNIYGSSRLGVLRANQLINCIGCTISSSNPNSNWLGKKLYELTNHLGNVLATVTDKKISFDNNIDNLADWYLPEIASANDYYPFGMLQPERKFNAGEYRFGFNGQEEADDISEIGSHTTALFWEYDTRLGRRWNLDPKPNIAISSYSSFTDNPVFFNDILGDSAAVFKPNGSFWKFINDGESKWSGIYYQNSEITGSKIVNGVKTEYYKYSNPLHLEFNDPTVDILAIKNSIGHSGNVGISRIEVLSNKLIDNMLNESNVRSYEAQTYPIRFANQEGRQGRMDYGHKGIISGELNQNTFYLRDGIAYNVGDIGNYIWGYGMAELGISLSTASIGAHINNIKNGNSDLSELYDFGPGTYGKPGFFDSSNDQWSIIRGYKSNPKGKSNIENELKNWPKYNPK